MSSNRTEDTSAICHVFTTATRGSQKGSWQSIGAFLSPRFVLTTNHSVFGMHEITVQKPNGQNSRSRYLNPIARDATLDVAIIDLLVPIGRHFLKIPPAPYAPIDVGILKTEYNSQAASHPVTIGRGDWVMPIIQILSQGKHGHLTTRGSEIFTTSVPVIPGYSGSPIVAPDGETVLSIVTRHTHDDQKIASSLASVLQTMSGITGLETALPMIPFHAAHRERFHGWLRSAAKKMKLEV